MYYNIYTFDSNGTRKIIHSKAKNLQWNNGRLHFVTADGAEGVLSNMPIEVLQVEAPAPVYTPNNNRTKSSPKEKAESKDPHDIDDFLKMLVNLLEEDNNK